MIRDLTKPMVQACKKAADAVEWHPAGLHREPRYLLRKAAEVLREETDERRRNGLLLVYASLAAGAYLVAGGLAANWVLVVGALLFGVRMVIHGWAPATGPLPPATGPLPPALPPILVKTPMPPVKDVKEQGLGLRRLCDDERPADAEYPDPPPPPPPPPLRVFRSLAVSPADYAPPTDADHDLSPTELAALTSDEMAKMEELLLSGDASRVAEHFRNWQYKDAHRRPGRSALCRCVADLAERIARAEPESTRCSSKPTPAQVAVAEWLAEQEKAPALISPERATGGEPEP